MNVRTLTEPVSYLRDIGGICLFQNIINILQANSEDPDQTPHAVFDLGLHCLPMGHKSLLAYQGHVQ